VIVKPEENKVIEARLKNWGDFNRFGGIPKLGYLSFTRLMSLYIEQDSYNITDEIDAMYIGEIISSLDIAARRGDINWGDVYAYVLYQEYVRIDRAYGVKAKLVSMKFGFPCSEKTFKKHVRMAKLTVHYMAEPIVNKVFHGAIKRDMLVA
jgi:hypothetical protein